MFHDWGIDLGLLVVDAGALRISLGDEAGLVDGVGSLERGFEFKGPAGTN